MPLFSREPLSPALVSEMVPLIVQHFREVAFFKDIKIEPDFDTYSALDRADVLRIFTARENGRLVGYSVFDIARHLHFKIKTAREQLLFLDKDSRQGSTGINLIKFCDDQLKDEGIETIYRFVTVEHDFGNLLMRQGYALADKVYARRIS